MWAWSIRTSAWKDPLNFLIATLDSGCSVYSYPDLSLIVFGSDLQLLCEYVGPWELGKHSTERSTFSVHPQHKRVNTMPDIRLTCDTTQ